MDTLSFMRLIWPEAGIYLLAVPAKYVKDGKEIQYFNHVAYPSIEAASTAAIAMDCDRESPVNVFFALATVRNDYTHMNKAKRDAAEVKVRGRHKSGADNTDQVRAFWLDLDVKADPNAYATQQEAGLALRAFCQSMALPKPLVVSSGGGLHAYWPLTTSIDGETWQAHAAILKALTESWGLRADPSRTADVASILRPVGTYNWKTASPRPVQVVVPAEAVDTQTMLHKLQALQQSTQVVIPERRDYAAPASALGTVPEHLRGSAEINAEAATGAGMAQPLAREVVQRCRQLLWQLNNPQLVTEPQWYAMIGCMRFADKGFKAIHNLSAKHPSYSEQATNDKIAQHEASSTGPTLCQTFRNHNPSGCDGCPMRDNIKTPLQTLRVLEEAPLAVIQVETESGTVSMEMPPPPFPFKRVVAPGCDAGRIAIRVDEADGSATEEVIYEYDIYPVKLNWDERDSAYYVAVRSWLPHEGWQEYQIPAGKFFDRRNLSQTLGSMGVMVNPEKVEELVRYMVAYIRELQKLSAAATVYAQLGWRDDKNIFVLPDRVVTPQGAKPIEPSPNIQNALGWLPAAGDLEVWKQVVSIYNRPGLEALLFGFGVGFAAPLFRFTNFDGAVVSMVGSRGTGKSSSALCANSIWGHKKMGWMDIEQDTWKAFYGKLGVLNNIVATFDEITNLPGDVMSKLAYTITKGQGRQRLQQNGQAQENYGNWNTMMLTTSNASLHSRLAAVKADSSAEASRIFEYMVPAGTLAKREADDAFDKLNDHFGLAGPVYAQYIVTNRDLVRDRVRYWIREIDMLSGTGSSERFWSAVAASVLAGFEAANACGLTTANITTLRDFAVQQIHNMRGTVTEQVRSPESMIADYINSNLRSMIVLNSDPVGKTLAQVTIAPTSDKLRIRLERHLGRLYIDRADFRRFCAERNADPKQIQDALRESGVLLAEGTRMVLGKNTIYSGAQSYCWLLDFNSPALSGVAGVVQVVECSGQQEEAV